MTNQNSLLMEPVVSSSIMAVQNYIETALRHSLSTNA